MATAKIDPNRHHTLIGVSSVDGITPINIVVNPATGAVLIDGTSLYADLDPRYVNVTGDTMTGDLSFSGAHGVYFRDGNTFIYSGGAGYLTLVATNQVLMTTPSVQIGRNVAEDLILNFNSLTNDGIITWKDTENYFLFGNDVNLGANDLATTGDLTADKGIFASGVSSSVPTVAANLALYSWDGSSNSSTITISGSSDNFTFTDTSGNTMTFSSGSIIDDSGAISFGDENLSTTGTIQAEQLTSTDDITMQGHQLTLGDGTDTDIELYFDGSTSDGIMQWKPDVGQFLFGKYGGEAMTLDFDTVNTVTFGTITGVTTFDFGAINLTTTGALDIGSLTTTDVIKDTNIDWGLGANQVNSDDIPDHGTHSIHDVFDNTINRGVVSSVAVSDDGGLNVSWGTGEIYDNATNTFVETEAGNGSVTDNAITYLKWAGGTTLTLSNSISSGDEILVAIAHAQDADILDIRTTSLIETSVANTRRGLRAVFPVRVTNGLSVSEDTDVTNDLDVVMDAGSYYLSVIEKTTVAAAIYSRTTNMVRHYLTGGAWDSDTNAEIDTTNYNDGTNRSALPANKWVKAFFIYENGKIHWVYPTEYFDNEAQAIGASLPTTPSGLSRSPKLTAIVYRQGDTDFTNTTWQDIRPINGGISFNTVTDHGSLAGLADDDHTQYLLADGTRALAGAWDMGNYAITNINIDTGDIATAVTNTEWDAAYSHVSSDGSDHTYIDQSVVIGSSPTFDGANFTGIPDGALDLDYVEVAGDTMTGGLTIDGTADEIQLKVQGHSTQNTNIFEVEDSAGVDLVTVDNGGNVYGQGFQVPDGGYVGYSGGVEWLFNNTDGVVSMTGMLGVGTDSPIGQIHAQNLTVSLDAGEDFYGIYGSYIKTAGSSNTGSELYGSYNRIEYNHTDATISYFYGTREEVVLTDGNVGTSDVSRFMKGFYSNLKLDGGKVWGNVMGNDVYIDQAGANEVTGDIYGQRLIIDADGTTGGSVYGLYIDERNNVDYGIYQTSSVTASPNYLEGNLGVGATSPSGRLHVDQSSTTGAIPVLYLDQADVSEEMIEFNTTIGVGNAIETVGGKTLTTTHFIKVTLPGALTRYIPCGTIS